ncbi:MurR/RpiR family transcriptional regulator [Paenibacillus cisolokensis]|nr:MurR/RpiR family transcriptional regulator [Paenibacillus cisolokensis]
MLESIYPSLTNSEQRVARTVLDDLEGALFYTITDLAEKANVGETTVIRLCRKLGFKGYQEFKLAVVQNISSPTKQIHDEIQEDDSLIQIAEKLGNINTQTIQNTTALLDEERLQRTIDELVNARKIYFFGVGSSGITVESAKYRFMRMGFNVEAATDAHIIAMNAAVAGKGDVVVGISVSGSTKDLVDAVRIAKQGGATIICLTHYARSPITQYADVVLLGSSRENPLQGGAFSSKMAQIHILDIICTALSIQHRDKVYNMLQKTARSVSDKLY